MNSIPFWIRWTILKELGIDQEFPAYKTQWQLPSKASRGQTCQQDVFLIIYRIRFEKLKNTIINTVLYSKQIKAQYNSWKYLYKLIYMNRFDCNTFTSRHFLWSFPEVPISFQMTFCHHVMFSNHQWQTVMSRSRSAPSKHPGSCMRHGYVLHLNQPPLSTEGRNEGKKTWGLVNTWRREEVNEWDLSLKGSRLASQPSHHFNVLSCSDV